MTERSSRPLTAAPLGATAALALNDGTIFWGTGIGAAASAVGEVCFNTSITGYQEILTDPSYAGQIITFTFPHIGNVGANTEDMEATAPAARGLILRADITGQSSWRASWALNDWLINFGLVGISGIDTRALTRRIRDLGAPNGAIQHAPDGNIDIAALMEKAIGWPGLQGMDLAREVTCADAYDWHETEWNLQSGFGSRNGSQYHVVAIDYGAKRNILRALAGHGCKVTVMPATSSAEDILRHEPDGIFLSNGPGDPAATGQYAVPAIRKLLDSGKPIFGICLGHQLLALALGARTEKMHLGHRGANHPVKDVETGKVEITSQNHGFIVIENSLPTTTTTTHISLFDGTLEGFRLNDRPVFSVQYHPEASPGPQDSHYLFERFVGMM